jgi:hypothetical protein
MRRYRTWPLVALLLASCASAQPAMTWARADGKPTDPSQLELDATACMGEMQKAKMAATSHDTGNPITDGIAASNQDAQAGDVVKGCMAQHGYLLTAAKPQY